MARVYQLIKSEEEHERFEPGLVNGDWHAPIAHTGTTVCGVQLDGDDGITTGPIKDGPALQANQRQRQRVGPSGPPATTRRERGTK